MNVNVLIDSIVRQTVVLIAQLATAAGERATLSRVANQVFLELARELRQQGVGNKVIADMFGLALRTYHGRIRRLSESATERGRSLWEAVYAYVQERGTVLRADVLMRFRNDDERTVRGVLRDLVDSGLLFRSGRGDSTSFRAAGPDDHVEPSGDERARRLDSLVWVVVSQQGPLAREALGRQLPVEAASLDEALARLLADGRIEREPAGGEPRYRTDRCVIPVGSSEGWEAAVWDHYRAVVTAIASKLERGERTSRPEDAIGGSTYTFDVWPGHPCRDDVLSFLKETRRRGVALRERVESVNAREGRTPSERVIAYVGQTVLTEEAECPFDEVDERDEVEETP